METQKRLPLEGSIVISVGALRPFWVINVGGYIGSSTRSEIAYAITTGISIERLRGATCGL